MNCSLDILGDRKIRPVHPLWCVCVCVCVLCLLRGLNASFVKVVR